MHLGNVVGGAGTFEADTAVGDKIHELSAAVVVPVEGEGEGQLVAVVAVVVLEHQRPGSRTHAAE